ncbi:glycosyltransferase family 25 protein [Lentithecium fluviatile CBS 122367]|uniref:Glycosyltransferase family 25 protein n=1 Tax=Lentithecium fluviatile CBS 122367 TaxID=1168545 RepID=A0A6G1J3E0_9PLEO|nr:glycosyltransferase family 25 protein [Lentithecium fluviatile CBS 122367]
MTVNETLGFQEILLISMDYRTDRQDALALMAAETGLKIRLIPGVRTDTIHEKARPFPHPVAADVDPHSLLWLGIWRAHANAWRHIIDNNLQTALIIEDDVDWDENIKQIMGLWNWQLQQNNTMRPNPQQKKCDAQYAYGCDWDLHFTGQCKYEPHPTDQTHMEYHDPNAAAISTYEPDFQKEMTSYWNKSSSDPNIRIISPTYSPLCTMSYAISLRGAKRSLYQIGGYKPATEPGIDLEFITHHKEGRLRGYTLSPPPFVKWRTKGIGDTDNFYGDRAELSDDIDQSTAGGESKGLLRSVRAKLEELDGVVREWGGDGGKEGEGEGDGAEDEEAMAGG